MSWDILAFLADLKDKLIIFIGLNAELVKKQLPYILRIIIPLSLTVYLFAYKERKDITYSYLRSKKINKTSLGFIVTSSLIIIILYINYMVNVNSILFDTGLIIVTAIWTFYLYKIYIEIFNSVNIFNVFKHHLDNLKSDNKEIEKLLNSQKDLSISYHKSTKHKVIKKFILNIKSNYYKKKLHKHLKNSDICVQVTSQILLSKIKYNLPKDFSASLIDLVNELSSLIQITTKGNFQHIASLNLLDQYTQLYSSILRNVELLTEYTSKNGKSKDLELLIRFFNESTIGPYEFTEMFHDVYLITNRVDISTLQKTLKNAQCSFIQSVKSCTFILSKNDHWDDVLLLRNLKNLSDEADSNTTGSFSSEEVFTLYIAILIEAINNNDIKQLTAIVNIILEHRLTRIQSIIKLFILCATKAIELGHYNSAGHLIKMIILHSEEFVLKSIISDLHKEMSLKQTFSGEEFLNFCENIDTNLVKDFMISISFSPVSYEYCFSKLVYILSIQQRYKLLNSYPVLRYEEFGFKTPVSYVHEKIIDLHKEYGLVSLKENIIKKIEENSFIIR